MRIHLIRHGQSACLARPGLSREEYRAWVQAYDAAGISDQPPAALRQWLDTLGVESLLCSTLPRAVQSAQALGPRLNCNPLFNEAAVAFAPLPFRLSSGSWTALGRIAWLCGAAAHEGLVAFRVRAGAATDALLRAATEDAASRSASEDVVLVGHGWMNRTLGQALRQRGFELERSDGHSHWARTTFIRRRAPYSGP